MQRRGLNSASLGELMGYDAHSIGRHIGAGAPNLATKFRIERALDFYPLWSLDRELWARRQCVDRFDCDPRLLTFVALKALCRRLGVASPIIRQREAFFQALVDYFAAHPKTKPIPETPKT